ncbi:MAG: hypothetical protein ACOX6G_06085 [Christensenellales bacterium]|jgi:predicted RNA-binding Zn-ribbon protein involved in translation (DUF1610 family)|nr:hypothetical protein [Clostridiales bacterium]
MSAITYQCPSCGSSLTYDGRASEMSCGHCGNRFSIEALQAYQGTLNDEARSEVSSSWTESVLSADDSSFTSAKAYHCNNCGADLMTDETTVASSCAFCGSPAVIPSQFTESTFPAKIIPFLITEEQAQKIFKNYFQKKKLLPKIFRKNNRIDKIRKLYVPYWLFSGIASGDITYNATKVNTRREGNYRVTTTSHYLLRRAGTLDFNSLPVDANSRIPNEVTESIEPYDMSASLPFSFPVLAGTLADRADVDAEVCKQRADERIARSVTSALNSTTTGYSSAVPRTSKIHVPNGVSEGALFPLWHITTKKEDKVYSFAINGQTGEYTCNIPYSTKSAFAWFISLTLGFTSVGSFIYWLLYILGVIV